MEIEFIIDDKIIRTMRNAMSIGIYVGLRARNIHSLSFEELHNLHPKEKKEDLDEAIGYLFDCNLFMSYEDPKEIFVTHGERYVPQY